MRNYRHHKQLICGLLLGGFSCAALPQSGGTLWIHFEGMKNSNGKLAGALVDSAEQFLAREQAPAQNYLGEIVSGKATWEIENLAFGEYALSAFHDENANGELDSGLFGIPTEDYGFSNNARGSFGPPDFADAVFEFSRSGQTLTIWIR